MAIQLLTDEVINKIAAGEVIERPASIVKELIENSIDAGASLITVRIQNGGVDEIQVEDNGTGIDHDELPTAFLRHATSKLSSEEDLFAISTMGFRGEALPSIASVSRIEMYTKTADAAGSKCIVEGGMIKKLERYPTGEGTKIIIKDLFYNTPVRKTFLKSQVSEGNSIYETVCKYALAYPEISFVFDNQKKTQFKTPGNGSLRDTVFTLFGSDMNQFLMELDEKGSQFSLQGLISKPEYKRNNRRLGFFFVNKRPVRSPILNRAMDNAYRGLLVSREFPVFFLSLTALPDSIDVNIHPQKSEVRFRDEQTVIRFVSGVVKKYLDASDFRVGNHFQTINRPIERYVRHELTPDMFFDQKLLMENNIPAAVMERKEEFLKSEPIRESHAGNFSVIGQLLNSYILIENENGLFIIDQHAAHERICYNQILELNQTDSVSEPLILPLALDLGSEQIELLENHHDILQELGFEIDIIGHNSIVVRAVPGYIAGNELAVIQNAADMLKEGEAINLKEEILMSMACEKAVTAGTKLGYQEMFNIVSELLQQENYKNCPHGRPTMININHSDLERMFKR